MPDPVRQRQRVRRRGVLAPPDPVAPVWWPEYVALPMGRDKAMRVASEYSRRWDLATWYVVKVKGVSAKWLASRLGVSDRRVWNRVAAGRSHVERTGMSEEAVAELLFSPVEKLEARRKRRADRAQRLDEKLKDVDLPPPPNPWLYPWLREDDHAS